MTTKRSSINTGVINPAVLVAALGNFVDVYDLVLFGIVRVKSLKSLGYEGEELTQIGLTLMNWQMVGMLLGGVIWGILGDKKGRLSVLFGSILMYSVANIANGFVYSVEAYGVWRFLAGVGLAGELGAGITLVAEVMPREKRGYGTMLVASIGLLGAVAAGIVGDLFNWRISYFVGGGLGLLLLFLRVSVRESEMFNNTKQQGSSVSRGAFFSLFTDRKRFVKYISCILIGLPTWYVIGIPATFAPEFAKELHIQGDVLAGVTIMILYGGGSLGDILSGSMSQIMRSRLKVMFIFLVMDGIFVLIYHFIRGIPANWFYAYYFLFGIGSGFWVMLITIAAEQFGTNIRATVATTVPNFVRGAYVIISNIFAVLKDDKVKILGFESLEVKGFGIGFYYASAIIGAGCFILALLSMLNLKETFTADLDYVEKV